MMMVVLPGGCWARSCYTFLLRKRPTDRSGAFILQEIPLCTLLQLYEAIGVLYNHLLWLVDG